MSKVIIVFLDLRKRACNFTCIAARRTAEGRLERQSKMCTARHRSKGTGRVSSVHGLKACRGRRSVAVLVLNLGIR